MQFLSVSFLSRKPTVTVYPISMTLCIFFDVSLFVPLYVWYPCSPFFWNDTYNRLRLSDQLSDQNTSKDIIHKALAKNIVTSWEGRLRRMIIYVYHLYSTMYWSVGSLRRCMCYLPCAYNRMYWLWIHRDDWRRFVTRHVRDERRTHSYIFY